MSRTAFWMACGEQYVEEARRSAYSFHRQMRDINRILITDKETHNGIFDQVIVWDKPYDEYWYMNTTHYFWRSLELPYDQFLYMESDTYICEPIYDFLEMLSKFDIIGVHAPGRVTARVVGHIPYSFPEINIGVLAYRNNMRVQSTFDMLKKLYDDHSDVYKNNDQAPLREALWNSNVNLYVAPPEYNCRFRLGGSLRGKVRVLHGRAKRPMSDVAKDINAEEGFRSWKMNQYM